MAAVLMTAVRLMMETEENDSGVISESRQLVNFHFCRHPTIVINKVIMQPQQGVWVYFKSFFFFLLPRSIVDHMGREEEGLNMQLVGMQIGKGFSF